MFRPISEPEFAIPDDERPASRCPHCERPFRTDRLADLHLGEVHSESCSEAERESYEEAYREESHDLFTFHAKVVVSLLLLYFGVSYTYAVVWH
ncbi:DUF7410 domain-containing protein [Natronorarus salvus]|uniref:DUF7410 domain-containing protein n=1 Tax=Natronorarus salvus TaxID=3117733 RepID=UPI002F265C52